MCVQPLDSSNQGSVHDTFDNSIGYSVTLTTPTSCVWADGLHNRMCISLSLSLPLSLPQWESYLVRTQGLNVLPLEPRVGQYIAIQATLTARNFFLANFYPSGTFTCIFPKPLPSFSC